MEKRKKGRRRKGKIEEGILYAEKFEFFRVEKEKKKNPVAFDKGTNRFRFAEF